MFLAECPPVGLGGPRKGWGNQMMARPSCPWRAEAGEPVFGGPLERDGQHHRGRGSPHPTENCDGSGSKPGAASTRLWTSLNQQRRRDKLPPSEASDKGLRRLPDGECPSPRVDPREHDPPLAFVRSAIASWHPSEMYVRESAC